MTAQSNLPENYTLPENYVINDFKKIVKVPSTDIILLVTEDVFGGNRIYVLQPDGFDNIYPCVALHKTMYQHSMLSNDELAKIEQTVKNL